MFNILHNSCIYARLTHYYQFDHSISVVRVVGWYFSFLFNFILKEHSISNGGPDQTPRFAASDLILTCLPMSHKKDAWIILVKNTPNILSIHSKLSKRIVVKQI